MMITVGIYAVFTGLSGLAQDATTFHPTVLTGLGIGGEFAAGAALVAGVFPDRSCHGARRDAGLLGIKHHRRCRRPRRAPHRDLPAWRIMFLVGITALLTVVLRFFVREPERGIRRGRRRWRGQRLGRCQSCSATAS